MKKALLIISLFFFVNAQVLANGALAIDSNQGNQYGFSFNYPTMQDAVNRALYECGPNCRIVKTFSYGCGAYAADQQPGSTAFGWGTANNPTDAQRTAIQYCRQYGGRQCIIRVWGCNSY